MTPRIVARNVALSLAWIWAIADTAAAAANDSAWLRVEATRAALARVAPVPVAAIDYGSFLWLPADGIDLRTLRDSGLRVTPIDEPFTLDLGGRRFDPITSAPTPQQSDGPDWQLVQFRGPVKPGWLAGLLDSGAIPVQYIHPYTYVVWADGTALARSSTREEIRWTGAFDAAYRVRPEQRHLDAGVRRTMALVSRHADAAAIRAAWSALGARITSLTHLDTHFDVIEAEAPGHRYLDMAAVPGVYTVQAIQSGGGPRGEMSGQSIVGAYGPAPNYTIVPGYQSWLDSLGYDGAGVIVSIVDGGFRSSHLDLVTHLSACVPSGDTPTSCSASSDSHGTHVAGAVAGTGASGTLLNGFLRGHGIAPGALLVQQRYNAFLGGGPGSMVADGMLKIYKESSLSGAVLTNNSWGPTGTPQGYDIPTQQVDIVIRDANPDLPGNQQVQNVWSIMNGNGDGFGACAPSSLGSPDEAKNLFAVGSTALQSSGSAQLANIFDVSGNSAHGNACDGRRVPNIVAPGCRTDSASNGSDTAFAFLCGTSMASPVVTGSSALFVEQYRDQHAGATPSPALIKAAFTAVAQDLAGFRNADGGILGHRPDRFQGYGRIDLDAVVHSPDPIVSIDQTEILAATGSEWTRTLQAADPARPVRIMLAWTDAKGHGLGGTTPAWVNDLDLGVTSSGSTYLGNVVGGDGWSATGGTADERNNLEGVFLRPDQLAGPITISVLAANVAADALDPYTPGAPAQDFALVCYNCVDAVLGSADLGVALSSDPVVAEAGAALDLIATVSNAGADPATGAQVRFELPGALTFVSGALSSGSGTWDCQLDVQTVICNQTAGSLPLAPAASVLTIATIVDPIIPQGAGLEVSATIAAPMYVDGESGNDAASVTIHVGDLIFADDFET